MDKDQQRNSSALFLIRLWVEASHERMEWHGRLVHVLSGEAHDFREWPRLEALLLEITAPGAWAEGLVISGEHE